MKIVGIILLVALVALATSNPECGLILQNLLTLTPAGGVVYTRWGSSSCPGEQFLSECARDKAGVFRKPQQEQVGMRWGEEPTTSACRQTQSTPSNFKTAIKATVICLGWSMNSHWWQYTTTMFSVPSVWLQHAPQCSCCLGKPPAPPPGPRNMRATSWLSVRLPVTIAPCTSAWIKVRSLCLTVRWMKILHSSIMWKLTTGALAFNALLTIATRSLPVPSAPFREQKLSLET